MSYMQNRRASKRDPDEDLDLKAAYSHAYREARDYVDRAIAPERETAMKLYNMEPLGTEEPGLSHAQMSVVRDMTNRMLPSLLRTFLNTDRVVEFSPRGPEDVGMAEQATDYVAHVITENSGYTLLHGVLHDALLLKSGIVKYWWDNSTRITEHDFTGLTPDEATLLAADPEIEVLSQEVVIEGKVVPPSRLAAMFYTLPQQVVAMFGVQPPAEAVPPETMIQPPRAVVDASITMRVKRTTRRGSVKICGVPPEEFIITRNARSLDDADFVGHRRLVTVSDLVAMGYDEEVVSRGTYDDDGLSWNREAIARQGDGMAWHHDESSPSLRRVLYVEGFLKYDADGDGIAELHKICALGDTTILSAEPVEDVPFALACPFPRPHVVIGDSLADLLADLQEIETHLLRGMLDSLSLSVNPRSIAVERDTNLDDLLASAEIGATIRVKNQNAVTWQTVPFSGQFVLPVLDFFSQLRAARTGITKASQGLDPDVLQSTTKAAVTATVEAALETIEMVARNIAETFFVRLARGLLKLISRHQDRPRVIRLRGEWVPVDPRSWDPEMDVSVNVALGRGDDAAKIASLTQVLTLQREAMTQLGAQNPLVGFEELSRTLTKLLSLMGHKDSTQFFKAITPETLAQYEQMQQGQPPPADQLLAQAEIAKAQAAAEKIRVDAQVELAKIELEREKLRLDADHKRDQLDVQIAIESAKLAIQEGKLDIGAVNALIARERSLLAQQRQLPA